MNTLIDAELSSTTATRWTESGRTHRGWTEAGCPTPVDTARAIARETIAKHVPEPLPAGASEALAAIVKEADARAEAQASARGR